MAGLIGMGSGRGGRRAVDAEIHLVPLIDLLCSLIAFLLMTAIWTQISRLELKNGADGPDSQPAPTQEQKMLLKVQIHDKGFTVLEQSAGFETQIACLREPPCFRIEQQTDTKGLKRETVVSAYDYARLELTLKELRAKFASQKDVAIVLGDRVPYNEMIKTMDTCLAVGLDGISLSGSAL